MKINARRMALRILNQIDGNHEFSHVTLNSYFDEFEVESIDRRFITHIVFGVLENKLLLDYYIRKLSKQRFGKINHEIVNILRMGIYQIHFMSKVPDSASVNESVKLAKKVSENQGNFVNGILRNFTRDGDKIPLPDRNKHLITHLSVKYSHPEWLVEKWINDYGKEKTEALMSANNNAPSVSIRTNTLKITREKLISVLEEAGLIVNPSEMVEEGIVIEFMNGLSVNEMPGFEDGFFQVQDVSSMCVGKVSNAKEGSLVIDVCAAPGGKSTHVAQLMNNHGRIVARDIHEHKLKTIEENVHRLGINIVETQVFNAVEIDEALVNSADLVLVDAPCSGLGIIRRKPDIKYNKNLESIEDLVALQKQILESSSQYVKIEGTLIYSTCTLNFSENQAIIKWFLKENKDFVIEPITNLPGADKNGLVTLFPSINNTDGFFIAKLLRVK